MPWTFAHVAAVLPFRQSRLPWTPLASGALAPDAGYYLGRLDLATVAHAPLTGLPLAAASAMVVLFSWHTLGPFACRVLPARHRAVLTPAPLRSLVSAPSVLFATIAAIALGVVTHVAWDSFTHLHGVVVQAMPTMQDALLPDIAPGLPRYRALQHASTVLGTLAIAVAYGKAFRAHCTTAAGTTPEPEHWRLASALAALGILAASAWVHTHSPGVRLEVFVVRAVIAATVIVAALAVAAGAWLSRARPTWRR